MEEGRMESLLSQVDAMGLERIWQSNEARGDYPEFSPYVHHIAEFLGVHLTRARVPPNPPNPSNPPSPSAARPSDGNPAPDEPPQRDGQQEGPPPYLNYQGTAIIPVNGPLSKMPTSLGHMFGGSSTVGMRKALAMALADSRVQRIMLHIDSPGGTVAGTGDLGDDIASASSIKPTAAFIEDLGASAAYWIASQAQTIYASPHSQVGSIGVYGVVHDTSEAAAKQGVKVHVLKTGAHKGGVIPGAPVSDATLKKMQAQVEQVHEAFVSAVAKGRGMAPSAIAPLADGSVYPARKALSTGLVDALSNFRTALDDFSSSTAPGAMKRPKRTDYSPNAKFNLATIQRLDSGFGFVMGTVEDVTSSVHSADGALAVPANSIVIAALGLENINTVGYVAPADGAPLAHVPNNPPGGSGAGTSGAWSKPSLSDFGVKDWATASASEKARVSTHYADAADKWTDNFDADLNLPHHDPKSGKANLNGVRNALARLSQVKKLHSPQASVRAHLNAHLPSKAEAAAWALHAEAVEGGNSSLAAQVEAGLIAHFGVERSVFASVFASADGNAAGSNPGAGYEAPGEAPMADPKDTTAAAAATPSSAELQAMRQSIERLEAAQRESDKQAFSATADRIMAELPGLVTKEDVASCNGNMAALMGMAAVARRIRTNARGGAGGPARRDADTSAQARAAAGPAINVTAELQKSLKARYGIDDGVYAYVPPAALPDRTVPEGGAA
jgi:signal peptide peptidase SppA